jgi:hypothetical protein
VPSYLKFKPGVDIPLSAICAAAAVNARNQLGLPGDTLVTSANDGEHRDGSKHFSDEAVDVRVHGLTREQIQQWATTIRKRLGRNFDVVVESLGTPNAHIHIEHDPKD